MIDLHYWPTPNGWKISIMLEECGLPYKIIPVNIGTGEQFKPDFLKISPNNRMPAIVDHDPPGGGAPVVVNGWTCQGYDTPVVLKTGNASQCRSGGNAILAVLAVPGPTKTAA